MSSFLDKLLSPNVARDIGAMGIGKTQEGQDMLEQFPEMLLSEAENWYNSRKDMNPSVGMRDWQDLSQNTKDSLVRYLQGTATQQELIDLSPSIVPTTSSANDAGRITYMSSLLGRQGTLDISLPSQLSSPESFGGIGFNPLSRESILENLPGVGEKYREDTYEGNTQNLLESVKPLTMEQIRKTTTGFYNPYIEKEKKPLVDRLIDKRKTAKALGGDFAGYGQREQYQDVAEGSFISGVENIYSDVDAARASALDDLYGTIASWQDVGDIS